MRVGLAGWSNPPTVKSLRGPDRSHLEFYAEHFSCVELNSSFYRTHRQTTYASWRLATPRSFRFAVKMPRSITHECGLRGTSRELKAFFASIEPLQGKLGAVLIQLPPSLEFQARLARVFFEKLPRMTAALLACEPRHGSWFSQAADELMERFQVARVATDPPRGAGSAEPGGSREQAYYRWHGSPRMYYSSYSEAALQAFAAQIQGSGAARSWCIFDNTAAQAAWPDALRFAARVLRATR